MSFDFTWLKEKGINVENGLAYTGGEEKYASALQRYLKGYEKNRKTIEDLLQSKDIEGYAIRVHAMKSNSRMIGADGLAAAFEELELAVARGDADYIEGSTGEALDQYDEVIRIIEPAGELGEVQPPDEISAGAAKEMAEQLLEALDEFDDEQSAELAAKLQGYPFRITQMEKLKKATELINDFLYDEAAELIKEIVPTIE